MYLFRAKAPAQSHSKWDLPEVIETIQAKDALHPLAGEGCGLV